MNIAGLIQGTDAFYGEGDKIKIQDVFYRRVNITSLKAPPPL
jgi:hypothetical protein